MGKILLAALKQIGFWIHNAITSDVGSKTYVETYKRLSRIQALAVAQARFSLRLAGLLVRLSK